MDKIQKIGTGAFIYKDNKVLVCKRVETEELYPGNWEIPGGGIKFGESAEEGLKREIMEELGVEVKILYPYTTLSYTYDEKHRIDIEYICQLENENIKLSEEHSEYRWMTKEEIKDIQTTENMREVILKGFDFIK